MKQCIITITLMSLAGSVPVTQQAESSKVSLVELCPTVVPVSAGPGELLALSPGAGRHAIVEQVTRMACSIPGNQVQI